MHETIRVLHVLTALGHGGAEMWLLAQIEPLRALGVESGFVLKAPHLGKLRHVAEERGARTFHVPLRPTQVGYLRGVARIARDYDVVHTHEFVCSGLGIAAGRLSRRPTVLTLHHFTFKPQTALARTVGLRQLRAVYGRASLKYATVMADAVTAFSRAVMGRVVRHYEDDPRCSFLRLSVAAGARASADERVALRRELRIPEGAPLVIHVGRFIEQKNHGGLLRVFRIVLATQPEARLLLIGQGPLRDKVLKSARDLVDRGALLYLGLRDDVPRLLAASDVLLFPSVDEGFGLVALEANGCGLPVVGSRVPGIDEAVVHGETGLLFALDDIAGMAQAVVELLGSPERARSLGDRGALRVSSLYSHEASANLLRGVYDRVLSRGSGG